jgi:hypothetical protein
MAQISSLASPSTLPKPKVNLTSPVSSKGCPESLPLGLVPRHQPTAAGTKSPFLHPLVFNTPQPATRGVPRCKFQPPCLAGEHFPWPLYVAIASHPLWPTGARQGRRGNRETNANRPRDMKKVFAKTDSGRTVDAARAFCMLIR